MLSVGLATATTVALAANAGEDPSSTSATPEFEAAQFQIEPAPLPTLDPEVRDDALHRRADRVAAIAEAEAEARAAAEAAAAAEAEAEREREEQQQAAAEAPAAPTGSVWDRLAQCESSGNWAHSGGTYEGGLQFHPDTWDAYKPSGYPDAAYQASREQQIAVGERVLASQGWSAWPACSRKLGLR